MGPLDGRVVGGVTDIGHQNRLVIGSRSQNYAGYMNFLGIENPISNGGEREILLKEKFLEVSFWSLRMRVKDNLFVTHGMWIFRILVGSSEILLKSVITLTYCELSKSRSSSLEFLFLLQSYNFKNPIFPVLHIACLTYRCV